MNEEKYKHCPECNIWLEKSKFKKLTSPSALRKYPDGYYWCCTPCFKKKEWVFKEGEGQNNRKMRRREMRMRRMSAVQTKYGLSENEHLALIKEQNNLCAICGGKDAGKVLCVDHNHTTGAVRGLLCGNCNVGLGNFRDNPKILESAIAYLLKSK